MKSVVMPKTQSEEKKNVKNMWCETTFSWSRAIQKPRNYVRYSETLQKIKNENGVLWANQFEHLSQRHTT